MRRSAKLDAEPALQRQLNKSHNSEFRNFEGESVFEDSFCRVYVSELARTPNLLVGVKVLQVAAGVLIGGVATPGG